MLSRWLGSGIQARHSFTFVSMVGNSLKQCHQFVTTIRRLRCLRHARPTRWATFAVTGSLKTKYCTDPRSGWLRPEQTWRRRPVYVPAFGQQVIPETWVQLHSLPEQERQRELPDQSQTRQKTLGWDRAYQAVEKKLSLRIIRRRGLFKGIFIDYMIDD